MPVEVTETCRVDDTSHFHHRHRRSSYQRSTRRKNGDEVFLIGGCRAEVELVRKVLMREARSTGMKMLAIAQLKGWAKMEDHSLTTEQQEEAEFMAGQLAVVETEMVELPSLGSVVPDPSDIVDLTVAMDAFVRDVARGNELLVEPVSLETAIAVAANTYRWARFWVVRHPDPIVRAKFAATLAETEPLRAEVRRKAERMIAKHRGLDG
jgi:hypothetical protein